MSESAPISDRFRSLLDAACDGVLSDQESDEFAMLLEADAVARKMFLAHVQLRTDIRFLVRADRARDHALDRVNARIHSPSGSASPIVIVVDSPESPNGQSTSLFGSFTGYLGQVGPLSYLASALLMCVALLAAWQLKVDNTRQLTARNSSGSARAATAAAPHEIGQIANMAACRWSDESTAAQADSKNAELAIASRLSSGQKLSLASGLLEISYDTGAAVILHGPAVFQVTPDGGFLASGRLTCRLDAGFGTRGPGAEILHQRSQASAPNPPLTPFAITTPTATVTDLGTEFGVAVDGRGRTLTHVFRGAVLVCSAATGGFHDELMLSEHEGASVDERGQNGSSRIQSVDVDARQFVRRVPNGWMPVKVFGTGLAINSDLSDSHWQVVARSDDPTFAPQDAMIVGTLRGKWRSPDFFEIRRLPGAPQWVSMRTVWNSPVPPGTVCTFRTSFTLEPGTAATAVLRGRYMADRCVRAIRLNGHAVATTGQEPKYDWERGMVSPASGFSTDEGFVEGTNYLEIDVEADDAPDSYPEMEALGMKSALGLRVWLQGTWRLPPQEDKTAD